MKGLVIKAQISRNGKYVIELTGKCMDPLLNPGDKAEIIRYGLQALQGEEID